MSGHGEKLTRKQEQAISALLTEPTITAAASTAGVAESTLRRWLQNSQFADSYRQARQQAVDQAIVLITQSTTDAVDTLTTIMSDAEAPASSRVTAAKTVLDTAIHSVEIHDLEARLTALEQAAKQGRPV